MSNRRAFLLFGAAAVGVGAALKQGMSKSAFEFNEMVTRKIWGARGLTKEFPKERAREPRANGQVGLDEEPTDWKLQIEAPGQTTRQLTLDEVKAFGRVEMTTELMCVEGWSEVVSWAGTPLRHLVPANSPEYVSMMTPDEEYYVGLDLESAVHPQTLLAWEMNGKPLTSEHGAPLRLVIPVKYGIKNIKRVGKISFVKERPADYWAERGYDWYSGL